MDKKVVIKLLSLLFFIMFALFIVIIYRSYVYIDDISIREYNEESLTIDVKIKSTMSIMSGKKYCILVKDNKKPDVNDKGWVLADGDNCTISSSYDNNYLYIKDSWGNITNKGIHNEVFSKQFETGVIYEYYMYPGMKMNLYDLNNYYVINGSYDFETDSELINLKDGYVVALNSGEAIVRLKNSNNDIKNIKLHITDAIGEAVLEQNKPLITCNQFSYTESQFIDKVLAEKVKAAGEGTRAAAIAVARFITLEFKYRVPYFFENGRLNNYEPYKHVDGEGRYYHKGLYLHESKYSELDESFVGPAIWGCDLLNFTTLGSYKAGLKYPNGLDCSGFISWLLYNAGFDMGDIGAGIDADHLDFTDLGERLTITDELMNSGRVKVGDLIGSNGHVAIIAGWDDVNIYIAESLDTTAGVVMTTVARKDLTRSIYKHVVLMDDFYKTNDNYTNMW